MPKIQYTICKISELIDRTIGIEKQYDDHFEWLYDQQTLDAEFGDAIAELSQADEKL